MLTHTSVKKSRGTLLIAVPAMLGMFCISQSASAQRFERKGNIAYYNNNTFELSKAVTDTIPYKNPKTGKMEQRIVSTIPTPIKMNGRVVYNEGSDDVSKPAQYKNSNDLRSYTIQQLHRDLERLEDGQYTIDINTFVIDEKGKIVYIDLSQVRREVTQEQLKKMAPDDVNIDSKGSANFTINSDDRKLTVHRNADGMYTIEDPALKERLFRRISAVLASPTLYAPAMKDGKPVLSSLSTMYDFLKPLKVDNHKLYEQDKSGKWIAI